MKYTEKFKPRRGDRVLSDSYISSYKYRIIATDGKRNTLKRIGYANFKTVKTEELSFMYSCPFLLFWQR